MGLLCIDGLILAVTRLLFICIFIYSYDHIFESSNKNCVVVRKKEHKHIIN